jgi:hypothetical protein
MMAGTKVGVLGNRGGSTRNARRHVTNCEREIPCRRAVAETIRGPARLSSTILSFSSSLQRRRRPLSTTSNRSNALCICLSIRTVLRRSAHHPQGGLRRRLTHPTQKPVEILTPLIEAFSPKDGLVLDPFCGSGSTLAAANAAGRDWLGIELDADYHRIAARRLAA